MALDKLSVVVDYGGMDDWLSLIGIGPVCHVVTPE